MSVGLGNVRFSKISDTKVVVLRLEPGLGIWIFLSIKAPLQTNQSIKKLDTYTQNSQGWFAY